MQSKTSIQIKIVHEQQSVRLEGEMDRHFLYAVKPLRCYMRLRLESLLQRGYQSRLADARLACKQDHAAFTFRGLVPAT
jgi:hypothetical protein